MCRLLATQPGRQLASPAPPVVFPACTTEELHTFKTLHIIEACAPGPSLLRSPLRPLCHPLHGSSRSLEWLAECIHITVLSSLRDVQKVRKTWSRHDLYVQMRRHALKSLHIDPSGFTLFVEGFCTFPGFCHLEIIAQNLLINLPNELQVSEGLAYKQQVDEQTKRMIGTTPQHRACRFRLV